MNLFDGWVVLEHVAKYVGACLMKKFADIDLSTVNSLNLAKLRQVRAKFAEEIMQHFDMVSHCEDESYEKVAKEIESYKGFNVVKHLENYNALLEHEDVLRHANLFDNATNPNLEQLMLLAHKHAPDDWSAKLYLQDDIDMIRAYKSAAKVNITEARTYQEALRQNKRERELIQKWESQLRDHYMATHHINLRKIKSEIDRIGQLYKVTEFPVNEPYACAVQVVHLISIYEYLLLNARENRNMLNWCNQVINLLDISIGVLKALPENIEQRKIKRKSKTFMHYFQQKQTKIADQSVSGNFVHVKQMQKSAYLN